MSGPVTVALATLGCRLNQVESQEMGALLESRGARVRVSAADLAPPQRLPAGVRLAILESPLSAELRQSRRSAVDPGADAGQLGRQAEVFERDGWVAGGCGWA